MKTGLHAERRHWPEGGLKVVVTIADRDLVGVAFDQFDLKLIDGIGKSSASIADKLQALQLIFYRMEQQRADEARKVK